MQTPPNVIALTGDLDMSNVAALGASLRTACGPTVLDLSAVAHLDSAALYELAMLRRRVGAVVLVVPSPQVRRTLQTGGFERTFRIVDNRDSA